MTRLPGGELRAETHYDGRVMQCFSERPRNLNAMFAQTLQQFAEREAIAGDGAFTYRQLNAAADAVAAGLIARGLTRGDRVALFLGNCHEFVVALLACIRLGVIVVPIGIRQQRAELEFLLNDCGAKGVLFEASLASVVPSRAETPSVKHRISVHGDAADAEPFAALYQPGTVAHVDADEEDVAVILYTSGTTGRPKGAQLTHLGVIHSSLTFARAMDLSEQERGVVAVPISHVTGLVAVATTMLLVGGCIVLMRFDYKTPAFLQLASEQRITYACLVPAIYTLCVMSPDFENYDLSAWRIGGFGGASMPVPTIEALAQKMPHMELINAYGATETTSPSTLMPRADWRDHFDSVGKPVTCGQIRVVDDAGQDVSPDTPGELWIAGPMVVPGYWNRPDANASEFVDGYWRSGDIGSMDEDGFVKVFDRKKDMINRGGFKVFCAEVESTLAGHASVLECAIIGRPDPVLGERVHALIVPREGAAISADIIRSYCADKLSDYKVPEIITVLDRAIAAQRQR